MSDVEGVEMFLIDEISGTSRMCRWTLTTTVARIYSTWDSDYIFECFDDAAIQPKNS